MRLRPLHVLLGLILVFVPGFVLAQSDSFTIELLGKSSITAGLAYERQLSDTVSLGGGLGVNNVSRVDFEYQDVIYTGVDIAMPVNLYGIVSLVGSRHRLISPFGLVMFTEFSLHRYRRFFTINPVPFVGLGYQLTGKKFTFRVPVYLAYLGEPTEMLPRIMPWVGLSFGFRF